MKISLSNISIFWSESAAHIFFYGLYSLVVLSVVLYIEYRNQVPDVEWFRLLGANGAILLLTICLFALSNFAIGWLYRPLGGEVNTFIALLIVSYVVLHSSMVYFIRTLNFVIESPHLFSGVVTLILLLPFIAFMSFMFLLASSDWRN